MVQSLAQEHPHAVGEAKKKKKKNKTKQNLQSFLQKQSYRKWIVYFSLSNINMYALLYWLGAQEWWE